MLDYYEIFFTTFALQRSPVSNINYNEKGQRTDIYYGNNSKTKYEYDNKTFRVTRILTTRNTGIDILQNIYYFYDPIGNITEMRDDAQQVHYFNNTVVAPTGKYEYDPLYRLLKAEGRELSSLNAPDSNDFANGIPVPNPSANAMQNYTQLFVYDQLGNIQTMSSQNQWTRTYNYNNTANNYLSSTQVGQDVFSYTYDVHGNMTSMPHLSSMQWDFADRLRQVQLNLSGDTAYYIYDSTGNRCRKIVEKGSVREERYYVDGYEVFRKFISGDLDFERQSLHISDDEKKFSSIETKTWENGELIVNPVPAIRYQYDNHLGSACLELDETASIISYEEYHSFGTTSYRSGRTETEVSLKRYKYVGKERDEETGLYYYGARYYAAWLCRFVSVDPLQFKYPHYTPYQYAGNKPISYIDLDGLEEAEPDELPNNDGTKLKGNPYWEDSASTYHTIDYFSLSGNWIGVGITLGANDERKIALSPIVENKIIDSTKNGLLITLSPSESFPTPNVYTDKEIQAMDKSYKDAETSTFEEGFAVGLKDGEIVIGLATSTKNARINVGYAFTELAKQGVVQKNMLYFNHVHPALLIYYSLTGKMNASSYLPSNKTSDPDSDTNNDNIKQPHTVLGYDVINNQSLIISTEFQNAYNKPDTWTPLDYSKFPKMISFYQNGLILGSMNYDTFKLNMASIKSINLSTIKRRNEILH